VRIAEWPRDGRDLSRKGGHTGPTPAPARRFALFFSPAALPIKDATSQQSSERLSKHEVSGAGIVSRFAPHLMLFGTFFVIGIGLLILGLRDVAAAAGVSFTRTSKTP
jgi:hypothetical protein